MKQKEKKISRIITFLEQPINSVNSKLILGYVIFFAALEVLAYMVGGIFSIIESRIWLISGMFCYAVIIYYFFQMVIRDVKGRDFIPVAGILLLLIFFGYFIGNVNFSDVNPDATQQMAAGVSSFQQTDWNFTGSAFLGYPNRQYLIAAIPELIFGRSIFTLHLGFALPFFMGLIMMYRGLREWCKESGVSNKVALVAVYAVLAFRFVAEYFMNFEQAITPISLTMIVIGFLLKFVIKPSCIDLMLMVWLGSFCAGSYTPVLASLGLLLVFLVLYAWDLYTKGNEKYIGVAHPVEVVKSIAYAVIGIVIVTLTILMHTKPDKMEQTREEISLFSYSFECMRDFFFDKDAVFFGSIGIIVLVYMIFSITLRLKIHDFIISLWALAVVVLANYMTGYTTYQKAWILQRTLIIIPVLIAGITIALLPYFKKIKIKNGAVLFMVVLGLIGVYNFNQPHQSFTYFASVYPMKYMLHTTSEILQEEGLEAEDEFNLIFYTDNILETNLECYTRFLYPNAHTYVGGTGEMLTEEDSSLPTIAFSDQILMQEKYSSDVAEYTYYEQRYKTDVKWYATVIR